MGKVCVLLFGLLPSLLLSQQTADSTVVQPGQLADSSKQNAPAESKRLFGIIPNFRTSASLQNYEPLTARAKFHIATQDAFDRGTVALAAAFAAESQLTNANRDFKQGVAGYSRYFATSYADFVIGDYMTEGIYPTLLHQDPRYFRKGDGGALQRLGYAAGQILLRMATTAAYSPIYPNCWAIRQRCSSLRRTTKMVEM